MQEFILGWQTREQELQHEHRVEAERWDRLLRQQALDESVTARKETAARDTRRIDLDAAAAEQRRTEAERGRQWDVFMAKAAGTAKDVPTTAPFVGLGAILPPMAPPGAMMVGGQAVAPTTPIDRARAQLDLDREKTRLDLTERQQRLRELIARGKQEKRPLPEQMAQDLDIYIATGVTPQNRGLEDYIVNIYGEMRTAETPREQQYYRGLLDELQALRGSRMSPSAQQDLAEDTFAGQLMALPEAVAYKSADIKTRQALLTGVDKAVYDNALKIPPQYRKGAVIKALQGLGLQDPLDPIRQMMFRILSPPRP